jgi:hypothetical protein
MATDRGCREELAGGAAQMAEERLAMVRRSIRRFANTAEELNALAVGVIIWSRAEGQGNNWAAFIKMHIDDGAGTQVSKWCSFNVRGDSSVELGAVVTPIPVSLVLALHDRRHVEGCWEPDRLSEDMLDDGMKAIQDSLTWVVDTKQDMDELPVGTIVRTGTESDPNDPGTLIKLPYSARSFYYYKATVLYELPTVPAKDLSDADDADPLWWLFWVNPDGIIEGLWPHSVVPPCVVLNWGSPAG